MKVNITIPPGAFEKFFTMTGIIILFLAACSNRLHITELSSSNPPDAIINIVDSISPVKISKLDIDVKKTYFALAEKNVEKNLPYDSLLSINIQWQKHYLALADKSSERGHKNDSLSIMMRRLSDSVNKGRLEERSHFFQTQSLRQTQKIVTSTYSMFDTIIVFCLIICTISAFLSIYKYIHIFMVYIINTVKLKLHL